MMAGIAGQIALVGGMGVPVHFFRPGGNLCVVAVAAQASRSPNRFARRILLMATLAFNPGIFVSFGEKFGLGGPYRGNGSG